MYWNYYFPDEVSTSKEIAMVLIQVQCELKGIRQNWAYSR